MSSTSFHNRRSLIPSVSVNSEERQWILRPRRCPMDKLPTEILYIILDILAYCDDQSSLAVVRAANATSAFSRVCKCVRAVCLCFGPAWANVNLFLSNWRPRMRPPRIEEFRQRLSRSRNAPLRICFNLQLRLIRGGDNIGDDIWEELGLHRSRWSVLHLEGPPQCQPPIVCVKAVALSALLSRPGPLLQFVSLSTPYSEDAYRCQAHHSGHLVVDFALIRSLTTSIPFTILHQVDNLACKSLLTYLDIGNQRGTLVVGLLDQATNLQTLVWRNNDLDVSHRPIALPLLEQLFIHSLRVAPPVVAENLVELVVSDSYYSLDDVTFCGLTGGYGVVKTLRYLDLMSNPGITNNDLIAIWDRCRCLRRFAFPSSPAYHTRTEMFREVANQVAKHYALNSRLRLKSVDCNGMPTREPGIRLYKFISRVGTTGPSTTIQLHWDIWRVLCGPCHGRFDAMNDTFFEEFKAENPFLSDLIMIGMYEKYLRPRDEVPNPFTLVLVFSSMHAALECAPRGVVFRRKPCDWVREVEGRDVSAQ
ncbi:hypothetical protein DFH06DRAFT_1325978 [Mycena polygramma]|nr:hypothetical protein DFH06DRAFT_1325978 [Mycena polygramma]